MTDLDGATSSPLEGERITTTGQFAAAWNEATPEQRTQWWDQIHTLSETASRCFLQNHEANLERAQHLIRILGQIEDAISTRTTIPTDTIRQILHGTGPV